ncbi:MAG: hypothetical protein U5R49_00140 [Deltaproteobacteria bacterium]|nr:hypothetical protein [Deltaproteobacteria bacterium]
MDVITYCSNMREEIDTWKSRINSHMSQVDRRSADIEESPQAIHKINELVTELEQNVKKLENQCPADWSSEKAQLDSLLSEVQRLWQEAADGSPDDL